MASLRHLVFRCAAAVALTHYASAVSSQEDASLHDLTDAVPAALASEDACAEEFQGSDCAISALQLHASKAQQQWQQQRSVVNLELFRPLAHGDLSDEFSNIDMFSLAGALHYLHMHAVWEHTDDWSGMAAPRTKTRAGGVDVVSRISARVRNSDAVLAEVGAANGFVDFGAPAFFVDGMATGPGYNWDYGDVVGASRLQDRGFPMADPYYQFSLSGFCPNLANNMKRAKQSKETGFCMNYSSRFGLPAGEVFRGGLCPGGNLPGAVPTGQAGCVYTYTPPDRNTDVVRLDELVGITKEDCGGRLCKDWKDWRQHCTNRRYKVKFNYVEGHAVGRRRNVAHHSLVKTNLCVEFDLHKACAKDCGSAACQRIPAHKRDVGLPFWRGRCDAVKNARRAEMLAEALHVAGAMTSHSLMEPLDQSCLSGDTDAMCNPDPISGTGYCSREWAGVCQPCYIPNANETATSIAGLPTCPWDIFTKKGSDYSDPALHVKCSSDIPGEYCCLYVGTCNGTLIADAMNVTQEATEDGFAYIASLQSTDVMMSYLSRGAKDRFDASISSAAGFDEFAYWQWGRRPLPGVTLAKAMEQVHNHARS